VVMIVRKLLFNEYNDGLERVVELSTEPLLPWLVKQIAIHTSNHPRPLLKKEGVIR
jgi:hypothetical protein